MTPRLGVIRPTSVDPAGEPPYAAHIRRLVEAAPPLSAEQQDRLSVLLRGSKSGVLTA